MCLRCLGQRIQSFSDTAGRMVPAKIFVLAGRLSLWGKKQGLLLELPMDAKSWMGLLLQRFPRITTMQAQNFCPVLNSSKLCVFRAASNQSRAEQATGMTDKCVCVCVCDIQAPPNHRQLKVLHFWELLPPAALTQKITLPTQELFGKEKQPVCW